MSMRYYETLYLCNPDLPEEEYGDIVNRYSAIVENDNGVVVKIDEWGKKTLAYKVRNFDKGYYVLMRYCGGSGVSGELHRVLRLDERIFKYLTVKLSDQADPEALKLEAKQTEQRAAEEAPATEELISDEEGENGAK